MEADKSHFDVLGPKDLGQSLIGLDGHCAVPQVQEGLENGLSGHERNFPLGRHPAHQNADFFLLQLFFTPHK
jgi:hypothetical protein